jgi:hypothetical protein
MKKNFIYMALIASMAFASCAEEPAAVSETVKVEYPVITLLGAEYVSIPVGGSFTDSGATAFDGYTNETKKIEPSQSGVDNTTPGMYPVIYEAKNKYGFSSQAVRWVAVTNVPSSEDIGGNYKRTNGCPVTITKVANGIYKCDNMGGVPGVPEYLWDNYFVQMNDSTIDYPEQPGPFGPVSSKSEKLIKSGTAVTLKWIVIGAGFGTSVRTFNRQ